MKRKLATVGRRVKSSRSVAKTSYHPVKFLWATILFFLCLLAIIGLIFIYGVQSFKPSKNLTQTLEAVSSLVSSNPTQSSNQEKIYESKYFWKVSYPSESTLDTSLERTELERVTIFESDDPLSKDFSGYAVDFSVESKNTTLSTFADKDSLKNPIGTRQYFSVATLAQKTGYKVKIVGAQEYSSYYLPLRDETKVLVVTTSLAGPSESQNQKKVDYILDSLELLD